MSFVNGIGTPHAKNAGYYRNDDRPSGGKLVEADVQTCKHCQKVLLMQAWTNEGAFCHRCMAPICAECGDAMGTLGCVPFLARLEREFDSTVKFRQYLKLAGLEPATPPQPFSGLITARS